MQLFWAAPRRQKRLEPIYYSPKPIGSQWSFERRGGRCCCSRPLFSNSQENYIDLVWAFIEKYIIIKRTSFFLILILRRARWMKARAPFRHKIHKNRRSRSILFMALFMYWCMEVISSLCWCSGLIDKLSPQKQPRSPPPRGEINFPSRDVASLKFFYFIYYALFCAERCVTKHCLL